MPTPWRAAISSTTAVTWSRASRAHLSSSRSATSWAGWINVLVRPVDVSDEALALDLAEAHGVDGSYLETDHTFTHDRERWYPTLIDRRGYEAWHTGGATALAQRAAGRVEELLASHAPTPLDPDVEGAARAVVDRVQAAAGL